MPQQPHGSKNAKQQAQHHVVVAQGAERSQNIGQATGLYQRRPFS